MIKLQATVKDLHEVISFNDATITGILIAVVICFGVVIYYLFRSNQQLVKDFTEKLDSVNKERFEEIKSFNELLAKVNTQYFEAIQILKNKK